MLSLKSTNESRVILIQMERWGLGKGINSGTTGLCNQNRIVVEGMSLESFNMTYRDEDTHVRPNMSKANIFALLL